LPFATTSLFITFSAAAALLVFLAAFLALAASLALAAALAASLALAAALAASPALALAASPALAASLALAASPALAAAAPASRAAAHEIITASAWVGINARTNAAHGRIITAINSGIFPTSKPIRTTTDLCAFNRNGWYICKVRINADGSWQSGYTCIITGG
jgi:hypothetical protein